MPLSGRDSSVASAVANCSAKAAANAVAKALMKAEVSGTTRDLFECHESPLRRPVVGELLELLAAEECELELGGDRAANASIRTLGNKELDGGVCDIEERRDGPLVEEPLDETL